MKSGFTLPPGIPWQTALIAAFTLGVAASPGLTSALTATRENWGQLWPILTGHLCHWTGSHLLWDLLVFAIAGPLVERRLGRFFLPSLALAGAAIIATVFLWMPQIESYRGLSGIDTFLYVFAALELTRRARPRLPRPLRGACLLPVLLLLGKVAYEIVTGKTLFAGPLGEGVISLPLAHLTGAILGLTVWRFRRRSGTSSKAGSRERKAIQRVS